jgi:hypothetical protein
MALAPPFKKEVGQCEGKAAWGGDEGVLCHGGGGKHIQSEEVRHRLPPPPPK